MLPSLVDLWSVVWLYVLQWFSRHAERIRNGVVRGSRCCVWRAQAENIRLRVQDGSYLVQAEGVDDDGDVVEVN